MNKNLRSCDMRLIYFYYFYFFCQSSPLWWILSAVCHRQTSVSWILSVFVGNRLVEECGPSPEALCTPCKARKFTVKPKDPECSQCTQCVGTWTGHPGFFFTFSFLSSQTSGVLTTEGEFLVFSMYGPFLTPPFFDLRLTMDPLDCSVQRRCYLWWPLSAF